MTNKKFQSIIKELSIRFLVFITQPYFIVPKDVRLNSTHHPTMKIHNKKELQQIAFNHSADIFRFSFIKITLTEQVKVLDDKIKANKAQYDLDREAAKTSALSSGEFEKYEYLTGEDLGYKPGAVKKARFEYSPLSKVFNKESDESDKKEVLLKRLKNIECKNEQQLEAIKDQEEKQLKIFAKKANQVDDFKNLSLKNELNFRAKKLMMQLRNKLKRLNIQNLSALTHRQSIILFYHLFRFKNLC